MKIKFPRAALALLSLIMPLAAAAQDVGGIKLADKVKIGGTIRGKYEYQTSDKKGRFEVRTARVNVSGDINPYVAYKAEIDLCDEGTIKMLDAYAMLRPWKTLKFTIGQMRVPFTIDAHRSPDQQYFANRSFIAKQVGNVRDVGARLGYTFNVGFPIIVEAGLYNGSGLTNQKDFWTNEINFSAKTQILLPIGLDVALSAQKVKPEDVSVMMYDAGMTFHKKGFIAEAEYLYKHYDKGAFRPVHAFDGFVSYDIPLRRCLFSKISPLVRYDFMTDHSDGKRYTVSSDATGGDAATTDDETKGKLIVNDYKRSRITGGVTLSLDKPFVSDIRVNYEKYFYGHDGIPKTSEKDKIVVEFMVHF